MKISGLRPSVLAFVAAALVAGASSGRAADVEKALLVDRPAEEDPALQDIWRALVNRRVDPKLAARVMKGYDEYIDERVEEKHLSVRLYPLAITELVHVASAAGWKGDDIVALLVRTQIVIDKGDIHSPMPFDRARLHIAKAPKRLTK